MLKKSFLSFYLVAFLHILGELYSWHSVLWTKPLLMPSLLLSFYFNLNPTERKSTLFKFALLALVFSTLGDILLQCEQTMHQPLYFYFGLGAFLIAQIMYIFCFRNTGRWIISKSWISVYIVYFVLFLFLLYPGMGLGLKIPVTVYGFTLTLMAWYSWRCMNNTPHSFITPIGALLFVASDSILAINKFKSPIPHAGFWVMVTYLLAQYLIVSGLHYKFKESIIAAD